MEDEAMVECRHGIDEATCDFCTGKVRAERREAAAEPDATYNRTQCVDRVVNGKQIRGCGGVIAWVQLASGRRMPIELAPRADGNVVLTGGGAGHVIGKRAMEESTDRRYVSHFVTCPHAEQWKRPT